MRFILNAGEAIVAKTAKRFLELLCPQGLPANAMRPAWGMSETSSAVTFSNKFALDSIADSDSFVEVGAPIPGISIRIVDSNEQVVEQEAIGRLQVKGVSITSGYYQNPELNREVFTEDGWFNTGDLGFLKGGRLTITGRTKDTIVVNGLNYYSHEIEAVVEEVEGVEVSYTAACAVRTPDSNSDKLAIFFHTTVSEPNHLALLIKDIRASVVKKVGLNPNYLIPVEKETIPKTEIGKIQRSQLSQGFERGEFDSILQQFDTPKLQTAHRLPKTEIEKTIGPIWKEVLHLNEVGIYDNFFDLGGNSLLIAEVVSKLQSAFKKEISITDMFQYPTIKSLAEHLGQGSEQQLFSKLLPSKIRGENRRQRFAMPMPV